MKAQPKTLTTRLATAEQATVHMEETAAQYLERRAAGACTKVVGAQLTEAVAASRRAERYLAKARRRGVV